MSTVAEVVGTLVARLGAGHAFGVVGSGNFHVTNALTNAGVEFVATRHEGGAATMADAYARTSGRVGVLTLHQGCGLTNAMTGITEAAKSRTPLLVLTADTAASAVRSNFRIDQNALAASVGAVPERVYGADTVVEDVVRAWRTARDGRRTVVLNLPLDVQGHEAEPGDVPDVAAPVPVRPGGAAVEALTAALDAAQRPVFLGGRGARGHGPVLRELAARTGALLATSAVANGLFAGDPFDLGISGGFSTPVTAELIRGADLLVGWGCSLTMWTLRHGRLIGEGTRLIQIDDEADALGANRRIDLGVHGDVGETAAAVLAAVDARTGYRRPEVAARLAAGPGWGTFDLSTADRIDPRELSLELDRLLPAERTVAVDSGNFMGYPAAFWNVPDEAGFCFTQAFQSIGLGLATAVGAALARPDRLTVLGTGDGGLLMAAAELDTVARLGLPLLIVVYDDAAYGAEIHHFGAEADLSAVTFPDTDIAAIARGYGLQAATVRTVGDLDVVRSWDRRTALLLDAKIANDGGSWWLAEAFRGH
ncbi:thiamine pyrophosphate-binding protein [Cryptosporangium aurantiacum]|uniref:Acetolactate synthase large subunit n=1 Tax=Cryptosporangium aurantiacum TaxID=134849 RepID=A0A1M7RLH0_9ACTN|nr:thiamine pyrophosphate-binding protein [Cryptosporangium aurantiacum]SHN46996.1 Acetolactate synthase large subunit [Cryptosporangium aurantiacum]